jgi:AcrR family transcriptional regulator
MDSAEEKIILATVGCIEKYGLGKTTIRQIGLEAGMNSASVSYYFRSKEILLERVLEIALGNAFDLDNYRDSAGLPAGERLIAVMDGMLAGALAYPNITKAFFSDLFLGKARGSLMLERCNTFLDVLRRELQAAYPQKTAEEISAALTAIASATFLFPGLFQGFFTIDAHPELADEGRRKAYVRYVVETFLKE